MERLLNHSNLTYSRFRAVDGNQLYTNRSYLLTFGAHSSGIKLMEQKNNTVLPAMASMMKSEDGGRVGCWLSYLLLMLEIAASQTSQPVVILEDDVDVDANFAQLINSTIFKAPSDWDMLLCGYCCMTPLGYVSNDFQSVRIYAATHCFIIRNATTAARIAQRLDTAEISSPVDLTLSALGSQRYDSSIFNLYLMFIINSCLFRYRYINIYALINQIAVQRRDIFPSEIPTSGKIEQARLGNSLLDRLRQLSITTSTTTTVATTTTKTAANSTTIMINSINSTISDKKALTT